MTRNHIEGRLVTHRDGCRVEITGSGFFGRPGFTDLFGLGACIECRDGGDMDLVRVFLASPFLTPECRRALRHFLALSAPPPIRDLFSLLRGEQAAAGRFFEGRDN